MVINGALEQVGSWEADLSGYVTTENLQEVSNELAELKTDIETNYVTQDSFDSITGDLTQLINYDESKTTNIVNELNNLYNLFNSNSDKVGDLTQLVTYEEEKETTIVDELNNIYQRLVWQPITITD